MRGIIIIILFPFVLQSVNAQNNTADSFKQLLRIEKNDTIRLSIIDSIIRHSTYTNLDTGISYAQQSLLLAKKIKIPREEALSLIVYGWIVSYSGNYAQSIDYLFKALKKSENLEDTTLISFCYSSLAEVYKDQGDFNHALFYCRKQKQYISENDKEALKEWLLHLGLVYEKFNHLDSALIYTQKAYNLDIAINGKNVRSYIPIILGNIYRKKDNFPFAFQYYYSAIPLAINQNINKDLLEIYNGLAKTFIKTGEKDSSIFYAQKALAVGKLASYQVGILDTYNILSNLYETENNSDSTVKYLKLIIALKDKFFNQENEREIENISFNERLTEQEQLQQQQQLQNKIKLYSLLAALIIFLVIAFILYRNNKHKQKAYSLLQRQKQEINTQKEKVEQTLRELEITQAQLIQSEKMASLGELTAGVAHEIQNPLNFVNNFSEVNIELIDELQEQLKTGKTDEAITTSNDIKDNEEKIVFHGKRADAIVKGMLQHSRSSSGVKEPTDINTLADEYLRLAYHGLRAKDKSFNASMKTDYDETIGNINIVPQDIGRVILNLITNAFYAVTEKKKTAGDDYEPTVTVSTRKVNPPLAGLGAEIIVRDNGNGIPQKVLDKIFQPFFTTKPTGEGTGLGLSLSYDIIKGHGGELKVDTKEREYAEFTILLPL